MVDSSVFDLAKSLQQELYSGTCTISNYTKSTDVNTHISSIALSPIVTDVPCRLSFSSLSSSLEGDVSKVSQVVKLFLSPDITVLEGSQITVTQSGVTTIYKASGTPAVHETHQEVILELDKEYA